MGGGTDVRLAESISPLARPIRKAGRHPRGIPVPCLRSHLLEFPARGLELLLPGRIPHPMNPQPANRSKARKNLRRGPPASPNSALEDEPVLPRRYPCQLQVALV
jgi:hypothetical protein